MGAGCESTWRRGTPPGTRPNRRQVSWLAGHRPSPPSRDIPVALWFGLAAYSCGGSCGIGTLEPKFPFLTAFPVRSHVRDRRSRPLNGPRARLVNADGIPAQRTLAFRRLSWRRLLPHCRLRRFSANLCKRERGSALTLDSG